MEKNYYYLKEILLGLRQSYLNSQIKLDMLGDCISYNRIKYKDTRFTLKSEDGVRNTITCCLNKRLNKDDELITKIIIEDGVYKFEGINKEIQITNKDAFERIIDELNKDEFMNSTRYTSFVEKDSDGNKIYSNIMFDPSGIYVVPYSKSNISYIPEHDIIKMDITDEENNSITLDTKIPKECIPTDYITLIAQSNVEEKDIELLGIPKLNKKVEYSIDESNKKVLLIKRY